MFDNIGGKIKTLAETVCWIGIVVSLVYASVILLGDRSSDDTVIRVLSGFAVAGLGSLFSWIGSFVLYGFGELIEKVSDIAYCINQNEGYNTNSKNSSDYEEILRTEEERTMAFIHRLEKERLGKEVSNTGRNKAGTMFSEDEEIQR